MNTTPGPTPAPVAKNAPAAKQTPPAPASLPPAPLPHWLVIFGALIRQLWPLAVLGSGVAFFVVIGASGWLLCPLDIHGKPIHWICMAWKSLTLDEEAYSLMKKAKMPRESFGDMVRRILGEREADPSDLVDGLFSEYGGKGMMTPAARVRVAKAQISPTRSSRPGRRPRHAV